MGFCPANAPFYNTTLHICMACQDGTVFNNKTYQCTNNNENSNNNNSNTPTICPQNTPFYN